MAVSPRRKAVVVDVGGVKVGGDHPIVVQSMTNTDTADVPATVNQVMALARAGSRTGARDGQHRSGRGGRAEDRGYAARRSACRVPIIGDFHYNGHILLKKYPGVRARAGQVPHQSRQ